MDMLEVTDTNGLGTAEVYGHFVEQIARI